jgi:hypothetical protein
MGASDEGRQHPRRNVSPRPMVNLGCSIYRVARQRNEAPVEFGLCLSAEAIFRPAG